MAKKKDLGKGLRALLSEVEKTPSNKRKKIVGELAASIQDIEIGLIEVNPFQPRSEFDAEQLQELSDSIKLHGLVQPITVRSLGGGQFQLISGERRLRASKMAGLTEIPAYVRIANDQEMLEFALIENIQRQNLNAIEIAISYQRLVQECALTQDQLSKRVGKKRSTVANYMRLLKLPPEIQNAVKNKTISMGHARVFAGIDDLVFKLDLFKRCVQQAWSVRKLEEQSKATVSTNTATATANEDPEITRIKDRLSRQLGVKIKIKRNSKGVGQIVIPFQSDADFNDLIDILEKDE